MVSKDSERKARIQKDFPTPSLKADLILMKLDVRTK